MRASNVADINKSIYLVVSTALQANIYAKNLPAIGRMKVRVHNAGALPGGIDNDNKCMINPIYNCAASQWDCRDDRDEELGSARLDLQKIVEDCRVVFMQLTNDSSGPGHNIPGSSLQLPYLSLSGISPPGLINRHSHQNRKSVAFSPSLCSRTYMSWGEYAFVRGKTTGVSYCVQESGLEHILLLLSYFQVQI
jgi:hypothetical protein